MKNIIDRYKANKEISAIRKSAEKEFGKDTGKMVYMIAMIQASEELKSV